MWCSEGGGNLWQGSTVHEGFNSGMQRIWQFDHKGWCTVRKMQIPGAIFVFEMSTFFSNSQLSQACISLVSLFDSIKLTCAFRRA